jgi:hypothetical protein
MNLSFDRPEDLPGQTRVVWRRAPGVRFLAGLAAVAWPPLILTLPFLPPQNWMPGSEMDWRLIVLIIGAIAAPISFWLLERERNRTGRPGSRLGIIWRFMLYGGLLAAALEVVMALVSMAVGWFQSGSFMEALGYTETVLLIYGVGGLPVAILLGVSYALWAGLCVAFLAFEAQPEVKDRLGLMDRDNITPN